MIRRTVLLGAPISAAFSAILITQNSEEKPSSKKSMIFKASELPIYTSLVDSEEKKCEKKSSKLVETIEEGSKIIRTELTKVTDVYDSQKAVVDRYYVDFLKDTQYIRNYLQEEDNSMPRVGAILISSLAGVVLGVRGGFFRKIFYASITGSSMAAVCYPREAKKYATIAYNFAYGKSPSDSNQKDIPKFPNSFSEVKDQKPQRTTKRHEDDDAGFNIQNTILEESILPSTSTSIVPPRQQVISNSAPISHQNLLETPKSGNSDPAKQNLANSRSSSSSSSSYETSSKA